QIVGYYNANLQSHGVLLSGGRYTTLDVPGSTLTFAYGINDAGQIVGTYIDAAGGQHGFLATPVTPTVTCSVARSLLWPPDHQLVNVSLGDSVSPPEATLQVQVYANDNASAADAADIAPDTLQLRAARQENGSGRVYLVVVTATAGGQTAFDVCTVVVPHDQSAGSLAQVQANAAAAEAYYREFQAAPPGFHLLGEGPASAGLITNGGFEQPGGQTADLFLPAGNSSLTGWTIVSGSVDIVPSTGSWPAYEGSQSLDLDGHSAGTIEQSFTTTVGITYQ